MNCSRMTVRTATATIILALSFLTHAEEQGMPVEVVKVTPQELKSTINSIGTLKANQAVRLASEVSGRISAIEFNDGSSVSSGQVLFKLDNSMQQAQLNEARARVSLAEVEFERTKRLFNQKAASNTDLDSAKANLNINQAQLQYAQAQLKKLVINAPFSGMIGIHNLSIGEYVIAGTNLVELVDLSKLKFDFALPETYLSKVEVGQNIEISTPAFPGKTYSGVVSAISPALNEQTRSLSVRALIDNASLELRPGLFAGVTLEVGKNPQALMVPEQALIPQDKQYFIMKVVDGMVVSNPVKIGKRRKADVEIVSGVSSDDVIIIAGQIKVRPGDSVTPLFPEMLMQAK